MVTFDKGGRVPRLDTGAHLDARQAGILFARLAGGPGTGRSVHLDDWDRDRDPNATRRIEALLEAKGPDHKQTLLLALSMSVLTRFTLIDHEGGHRYRLEGTRSAGYTVTEVSPNAPD